MSASESQVSDNDAAGLVSTIVAYLGHVEVGESFGQDPLSYYLKLGVLKLRLCRWYDRITEVVGVDSGSFRGHLDSICLPSGEAGARAADTSSFNNWIVRELDFLSQKHHTHDPPNTERTTLNGRALNHLIARVSKATEKLEANFPPNQGDDEKERLDLMRHEDAKYINGRPEANQRDLHLLEDSATQVDPDFARLVALRKGHEFVDTSINGKAVVGDEVATDWKGGAISNGSLYKRTTVTEHGVAVIGNRYGGESIFARARTDH
ncbi:hypothetical protein F5X98DRAFT_336353 [Xylaria grammica]|nr:hypothetical protein F5X98DRAFT_336353 [Xylaria grammica]